MGSNLFALKTATMVLQDMLEESGGELTPEIEERIQYLKEDTDSFVMSTVALIKENKVYVKALKEEKQRLNTRQQQCEKAIETLERALHDVVQESGDTAPNGLKRYMVGTTKVGYRRSNAIEISENIVDYIKKKTVTLLENRVQEVIDDQAASDGEDHRFAGSLEAVASVTTEELMEGTAYMLCIGYDKVEEVKADEITGDITRKTIDKPIYCKVTGDDFKATKLNVTFEVSAGDLIDANADTAQFGLAQMMMYFQDTVKVEAAVSKTDMKKAITEDKRVLAIAKQVTHENISYE